jgi:hypothetical protein
MDDPGLKKLSQKFSIKLPEKPSTEEARDSEEAAEEDAAEEQSYPSSVGSDEDEHASAEIHDDSQNGDDPKESSSLSRTSKSRTASAQMTEEVIVDYDVDDDEVLVLLFTVLCGSAFNHGLFVSRRSIWNWKTPKTTLLKFRYFSLCSFTRHIFNISVQSPNFFFHGHRMRNLLKPLTLEEGMEIALYHLAFSNSMLMTMSTL